MALFFKTWESKFAIHQVLHQYLAYSKLEMVLFHASFVALKARCPLTINVNEEDYRLAGENKVFQGYAALALVPDSLHS